MVIDMGSSIVQKIIRFGNAHQIKKIVKHVAVDRLLQKQFMVTKWQRSHPKSIHAANVYKSEAIRST